MGNGNYIFSYGPKGRALRVTEDGRLVTNNDPTSSGYVFCYGDTGRAICVDNNGALLISSSGSSGTTNAANLGTGSGIYASKSGSTLQFKSLVAGSGITIDGTATELTIRNTDTGEAAQLRTDFDNASGVWTADIAATTLVADQTSTDFTNASGVWTTDIATTTAVANQVSTDFGNASGVWDTNIATAQATANAAEDMIIDSQGYTQVHTIGENIYAINTLNDRIYVGARSSNALYELSSSGWNKIKEVPSATRINALYPWRGKLYIGILHDAEVYSLDGHTLDYVTKASGIAGRINSFGEWDNKLIYTTEANYGSNHPIFYYDGATSGVEVFVHSQAPSWGWTFAPIGFDNKLFVFAPNEPFVHEWDGYDYKYYAGSARGAYAKVFKGQLYAFGSMGIWKYQGNKTWTQSLAATSFETEGQSVVTYGGKMYAISTAGTIYYTDGSDKWQADGTVGETPGGLAVASGILYAFTRTGKVFTRKNALQNSLFNPKESYHGYISDIRRDFHNASGNFINVGEDTYKTNLSSGSWLSDGSGNYYQDVVHNLGTYDIMIESYDLTSYRTVLVEEYERQNVNTVRVIVNASGLSLRTLVIRID